MSEDAPMPPPPPQSPTPNPPEEDLLEGPSGKDHWPKSSKDGAGPPLPRVIPQRHDPCSGRHFHGRHHAHGYDRRGAFGDKLIPFDQLEVATPFAEPNTPGVTDPLAFPRTVIVGGMQPADVISLRNTITATTLPGGPATIYFLSTRPLRTHFAGMWVDIPHGRLDHFKQAFVNKILTTPDFYTLFLRDRTRIPDPGGEHPLGFAGAVQVLAYHMHVDQITFNTRTRTRTQQPTVGTCAYILPFSLNNADNINAFYALLQAPTFEFRVGLSGFARLWRGPNPNRIEKVHCFQCLGVDHFAECCHIIASHAHQSSHPVDAPRVRTAAALVPAAQFVGPSTPSVRGQGDRDNRGCAPHRKPY
uniref:Uncharacterized protein n=1 Tax=Mycena chlorophos TaxID=658473 RepID=A0ABQ0LAW6_MYCCL|nr:predicted protein [Mycena chlorophos]